MLGSMHSIRTAFSCMSLAIGYAQRVVSTTHIAHSQLCIPSVTPNRVCISLPQILVSLIAERKGSTAATVYDRMPLHCCSHTDDIFH